MRCDLSSSRAPAGRDGGRAREEAPRCSRREPARDGALGRHRVSHRRAALGAPPAHGSRPGAHASPFERAQESHRGARGDVAVARAAGGIVELRRPPRARVRGRRLGRPPGVRGPARGGGGVLLAQARVQGRRVLLATRRRPPRQEPRAMRGNLRAPPVRARPSRGLAPPARGGTRADAREDDDPGRPRGLEGRDAGIPVPGAPAAPPGPPRGRAPRRRRRRLERPPTPSTPAMLLGRLATLRTPTGGGASSSPSSSFRTPSTPSAATPRTPRPARRAEARRASFFDVSPALRRVARILVDAPYARRDTRGNAIRAYVTTRDAASAASLEARGLEMASEGRRGGAPAGLGDGADATRLVKWWLAARTPPSRTGPPRSAWRARSSARISTARSVGGDARDLNGPPSERRGDGRRRRRRGGAGEGLRAPARRGGADAAEVGPETTRARARTRARSGRGAKRRGSSPGVRGTRRTRRPDRRARSRAVSRASCAVRQGRRGGGRGARGGVRARRRGVRREARGDPGRRGGALRGGSRGGVRGGFF